MTLEESRGAFTLTPRGPAGPTVTVFIDDEAWHVPEDKQTEIFLNDFFTESGPRGDPVVRSWNAATEYYRVLIVEQLKVPVVIPLDANAKA